MRVLLSAFGFSPYRGSECAVGWNIAKELAKSHDVTVITGDVRSSGYETEYARYVKENGRVDGLTVVYIMPTRMIRLIEWLHNFPGLWALYYLSYNMWQRLAYKKAKKIHLKRPFDVAHHLTMIGYREPGYMWKLGIPFFWGPVGGSVNEPIRFAKIYSVAGVMKSVIRYIVNGIQKQILIRPRIAAMKAKKIWAVTSADVETIANIWGRKCTQMIETAALPIKDVTKKSWNGRSPLRLVWSGTHTYGKAMPILIHAISVLKRSGNLSVSINVDVLGRGGETAKWKRLSEKHGVSDCFNWIGYVPRNKALQIMSAAHVLVFTSVKEGTPHVVLEAISLGLPVICHDACGMGFVVDEKSGIKIPMKSPSSSISGFAAAIHRFIDNPDLVNKISAGALIRACELTWEGKARKISDAYNVLEGEK